MTAAALVTGNTVILKPAEQSSVIAWQLVEIFSRRACRRAWSTTCPAVGEEVGPALVNHPDVDLIAFTGSRDVGLLINRQAAEIAPGQDHVKRVIAEMGGKNAIIVDDDADLDEAVVGVVASAFGYSGPEVLGLLAGDRAGGNPRRLPGPAGRGDPGLKIGPAEDPSRSSARSSTTRPASRILEYRDRRAAKGGSSLEADVGELGGPRATSSARTSSPTCSPTPRVAQEEIFGPVLAVIKASDLDDALRIANGTQYALTGGLYSRSPANIDRVKREFRVGNLYINRKITGASVDRQPFGGFKLSGIGTKAGGPDYLLEFLLTRSITENTMRRGFAPEELNEAETLTEGKPGPPSRSSAQI